MVLIRGLLLAAAFALSASSALASSYCSDASRQAADRIVYEIGTWRDLENFYLRYGDCSDDTLMAGLADRVCDLLANHWETLGQLQDQFDRTKKYREFVLSHIDTLMRREQANAILDNVHNRCPAKSAALCAQIEAAVNEALPHLWGGG